MGGGRGGRENIWRITGQSLKHIQGVRGSCSPNRKFMFEILLDFSVGPEYAKGELSG